MDFTVLIDHRVKLKESGKISKYLDLATELKATVEYDGGDDTNCSWYALISPKRLEKIWRKGKIE